MKKNFCLQRKQNSNQIVWLLQKVRRSKQSTHGYTTFQEFLDKQQYSSNGILRYEKVFGRTYVSTGGADTTKVCALFIKVCQTQSADLSVFVLFFLFFYY